MIEIHVNENTPAELVVEKLMPTDKDILFVKTNKQLDTEFVDHFIEGLKAHEVRSLVCLLQPDMQVEAKNQEEVVENIMKSWTSEQREQFMMKMKGSE